MTGIAGKVFDDDTRSTKVWTTAAARVYKTLVEKDFLMLPAFVIKAEKLAALNYLPCDHPRPFEAEWINRGTDQRLRPSSINMLLRTLRRNTLSPSVGRLRASSGLRVYFQSETDRDAFARAFGEACHDEIAHSTHVVTGLFDHRKSAQAALVRLTEAGIPESAISMLWKPELFAQSDDAWPEGHSKLSVAGAVAGGGLAGAIFGMVLLAIPGIGPVVAAGAIASGAMSSVAAVGAAIGATGGAIARMLTDQDVDEVAARYYEQRIRDGEVFVCVDTSFAEGLIEFVSDLLDQVGARDTGRHRKSPGLEDISKISCFWQVSRTSSA